MRLFQHNEFNSERFIKCLTETKDLIDRCNCGYSIDGLSDAEISMDLQIAIEAIGKGENYDKKHLKSLFSPNGPIQQIAVGENWEERFLLLSSEFDAAEGSNR